MAPGVGYNPEAVKMASDFPELDVADAVAAVIKASGCASALEISAACRRFEASGLPKVERAYSDAGILECGFRGGLLGMGRRCRRRRAVSIADRNCRRN